MALPSPARGPVAIALVVAGLAAALTRPAVADDDAPLYACQPVAATTRLTVSFKPETSVADLAVWVAGFTCESVIIAPDVAKYATRVQLITPRPLTAREAIRLFTRSLEAVGLKVRHKDKTFMVTLGPGMPRACPDLAVTTAATGDPLGSVAPPLDADLLAEKSAARIRKLDAGHAEIPRAAVDEILANPMAFGRGARVLPSAKGGVANGFKIYAVKPGSIFARVGLTNGDTLTAIDGHPLDTVDRALEAYSALRTANRIELGVIRRGTPFTLVITIVP